MTSKQSNSDVASSSKRRKVSLDTISDSDGEPHVLTLEVRDRAAITQEPTSKSLSRPITPPLAKRAQSTPAKTASSQQDGKGKRKRDVDEPESVSKSDIEDGRNEQSTSPDIAFIPSPLQLTRIRDLPVSHNEDTIGIGEILGDPLIKECWNFNFLFDLDWVMQQLDQDVRGQVQMRIVHGFWKKEDRSKRKLEEAASKYLNVKPIAAYIPDMFGTHHSKMLVLIRHDDLAQVIIHTANMIPRDWRNMTQAVWRSPLLPLRPSTNDLSEKENHPIGTGKRFKVDLLRYIGAYGWRLSELKSQLKNYDFSAIRAAFIGSSPSREKPGDAKSDLQTSWGWPGVQQILSTVPHVSAATSAGEEEAAADIVIQTSSIATLGANTTWLDNFKHALWKRSVESDIDAPAYPYSPTLNIIWPTAQEIRTSLDGYASGGSIHMKTTSKIQEKQLNYLKPYFRHWKHMDDSTTPDGVTSGNATRRALRGPAAPHIKTYIRFHDQSQRRIDWAMVTSANLSKQAWGDVENKNGEVWIQSWECGVVVWPELFSPSFGGKTSEGKDRQEEIEVQMVPVFGTDLPSEDDVENDGKGPKEQMKKKILVGLRMPYDLPLEPYAREDVAWSPNVAYDEPDWMDTVWDGY